MSAIDIKHVRYFEVTVTLGEGERRDLPAGDRKIALRASALIFQVGVHGAELAPDIVITATGRNIRKDGSPGGEGHRFLLRVAEPWAFEYMDRAVAQIARDYPGLVTP